MSTVITYIASEDHLSSRTSGLLISAFFAAYSITQIPGGLLADAFGARRVATVAVLWWSIFTAMTGVTITTVQMFVVRSLVGLGEGGLRLFQGEKAMFVERIYFLREKPVFLGEGWLAPNIASISFEDAERLSTEDMIRRTGHSIASSKLTISARPATRSIGKRLSINAGAPLIKLQRISYAEDSAALEISWLYIRSDDYELVLDDGERSSQKSTLRLQAHAKLF